MPLEGGNPEAEQFHIHLTKGNEELNVEKTLEESNLKDGSFVTMELGERKGIIHVIYMKYCIF